MGEGVQIACKIEYVLIGRPIYVKLTETQLNSTQLYSTVSICDRAFILVYITCVETLYTFCKFCLISYLLCFLSVKSIQL